MIYLARTVSNVSNVILQTLKKKKKKKKKKIVCGGTWCLKFWGLLFFFTGMGVGGGGVVSNSKVFPYRVFNIYRRLRKGK